MAKRDKPTYEELTETLRDLLDWCNNMGGWSGKALTNAIRLSRRIADANAKPRPKLRTWTVLALYPDYSTDDYGADYYMETVRAETAAQAEAMAQRKAHRGNKTIPAEDFRVICVLAGNHWNVMQLDNEMVDNIYQEVP